MCATKIASNHLRRLAQPPDRPFKICNCEAACLPIRHRLAGVETIKIDCDVNTFSAHRLKKLLKVLAPIITQYRAPSFSIFRGVIVCPGMNVECARAFGPTDAENLVRPPARQVSAPDDTPSTYVW